jgi:hypothetical protein
VPIAPGTKLGQYEVQDFIGQGAMGRVYRAYHAQLERTGAVKVLQSIAPDPDTTARFRHEAQAIAQMRHPNILNVFDFGEFDGTPYMIVEYVPGGSLADRLRQGQLETATALKYLKGIASGLDYAHSKGVIHRDVKPANVLLEADDTPVIADFGLAKLLQGSSLKSMTGVTTGTPAYMAPEQVTGSKVGPAADRYSLATIAYEMLTGVIPFDGEGLMELLYAQVHREPPPPSSRNTSIPPRVDTVIMRGLSKDPAARWESCTAFVDALGAALNRPVREEARTVVMSTPVAATMPMAAAVLEDAAAVDAMDSLGPIAVAYPSPPPPAPAKKSHRVRWALVAAAVVLALLVVAFAGFLATRPKPVLALSSPTVRAGDTVTLTASKLPANQDGEVELHSTIHTVPFHADSAGDATVYLHVPVETAPGPHTVSICWASACHASTTLEVQVPLVLPTPPSSPTPSSTPSPTPAPTASPTPLSRTLALSSGRIKVKTGTMVVKGLSFTPLREVTLTFIQGALVNVIVKRATTLADGTFLTSYQVPTTAAVGSAYLRACDPNGCAYSAITVSATG